MADQKITALTEKTTIASTDYLPIVDESGTPTTKKITANNLFLGKGPVLYVASSTSSASEQLIADYICDGTADDVQIQAALDALASTGGTVQLSSGTFILNTSITINKSSVTLQGVGWSTIIKAKASFNTHLILFDNSSFISNCIFKDFKMDGDKLDQSSGNAIDALGATVCLFENLWITAFKDYGIHFNGRSDNAFGSNNHITNCHFTNGGSRGVYIQRCDEIKITNNLFTDMSGYHVYDNSGTCVIANNVFVGGANSTTGIGVYVLNTANTIIANNVFDALYDEFIYIDNSDDCVISSNRMSKTGGTATKAIILLSSADATVITGNRAEGGANYPYVLKEQSSCTNTILGINSFEVGTTDTILMPSPDTSFVSPLTAQTSGAGVSTAFNAVNKATSGVSDATFYAEVDPGSTGDPFFQFSVNGVNDWSVGADNSDSDKFKIDATFIPGGNTVLDIGTDGALTTYGDAKIGGSTKKLGFYGVTTITRAILATGASHSVDDVITALQNLGLVKQS